MKVSVIRFENVDGKKCGKSFSFDMNPVEMAQFRTTATLKRRMKEYVERNGFFKHDELDTLIFDMKDFLKEWKDEVDKIKKKEEEEEKEMDEKLKMMREGKWVEKQVC